MNDNCSTSEPILKENTPAVQGLILNVVLFLSALPVMVMFVLFINSRFTEAYVYASSFAGILLLLTILALVTIGHIRLTQGRTILSIFIACLDILPLVLLILMQWVVRGARLTIF